MKFDKNYFNQKFLPNHLREKIDKGSPAALPLGFVIIVLVSTWLFFSVSLFDYISLVESVPGLVRMPLSVFLSFQALFFINWQVYLRCSERLTILFSVMTLTVLNITQLYFERYVHVFLFVLMVIPLLFHIFNKWNIFLGFFLGLLIFGFLSANNLFFLDSLDWQLYFGLTFSVVFVGVAVEWLIGLLMINAGHQKEKMKNIIRGLVHDVSNPLSVISGNLEILENNQEIRSSYKIFDRLSRIKTACELLEAVLRDAKRDFVATDKLTLNNEGGETNLCECIEKTLVVLENKLLEKNIQTVFDCGVNEIYVKGDKFVVISHILTNILSNSIKFSYPGNKLYLSLSHSESYAELAVKDQGHGISREILIDIFDPEKSNTLLGTAGESGTGYGLPLAHYHITALGGKIAIESKTKDLHPESHGTIVTLYFIKASQRLKRA